MLCFFYISNWNLTDQSGNFGTSAHRYSSYIIFGLNSNRIYCLYLLKHQTSSASVSVSTEVYDHQTQESTYCRSNSSMIWGDEQPAKVEKFWFWVDLTNTHTYTHTHTYIYIYNIYIYIYIYIYINGMVLTGYWSYGNLISDKIKQDFFQADFESAEWMIIFCIIFWCFIKN